MKSPMTALKIVLLFDTYCLTLILFGMKENVNRLTFETIRYEEWSLFRKMMFTRIAQIKNLFRLVSCPQNINDFDELLLFQQTGLIPSSKVRRSQVDKIKRLYIWLMTACYYDELNEETYNKFYSELDRLVNVFPYLCDPLIELGIYEVSKTN